MMEFKNIWIYFVVIGSFFSNNNFAAKIINLRHIDGKKFIQQLHNANLADADLKWHLIGTPHTDKSNIKHIRYQQYFNDIPVFGGYAVVHVKVNNTGKATEAGWVNGLEITDLTNDLQQMPANYKKNTTRAVTHFKNTFSKSLVEHAAAVPIIFIDKTNRAHWAYKVSGFAKNATSIKKPVNIIDAVTGAPLQKWNDLKQSSLKWIKARGYGGNFNEGIWSYGFGSYPEIELRYDYKKANCVMDNAQIKIIDLHSQLNDSNTPIEFNCDLNFYKSFGYVYTGYEGNGYDQINGAYSVMDDAYYLAKKLRDMYHDWYGTSILASYSGRQLPIIMKIHYGVNYDNAFWDGTSMTFGDGNDFDYYPFVTPDIVAHEVSHGFTEQNSDLFYFGEYGAINEAFSDMASQAMQQYLTGKNSWDIGRDVSKFKQAMRYMDNPTKDGISIDSVRDFDDEMDPHISSGIFNKLFYILASKKGWGVRDTFAVMVKANQDYWYPFSDFVDASCGIMLAASDLDYSIEDAHEAINAVGIDDSDCFEYDFDDDY